MKLRFILPALFALLASYTSVRAENHRTIIDVMTAKEMHDRGVLFVDVRSELSFSYGHIPGALNIDVRAEDFVAEFTSAASTNEEIVVYCRGLTCDRSAEAILIVHPLGYDKLYYLKVGLPGWIDAGFAVSK
jgi:rhodanese-related sulfurtransferase